MDFDELYNSVILSEQSMLEAVDEYTLYCFYTGLSDIKFNTVYSAPYRNDGNPSFGIYPSRKSTLYEYMWKDLATGESGTIIHLIQKIKGLKSVKDVLAQINKDFELGYETGEPTYKEKISLYTKPEIQPAKIRIAEIPFTTKGLEFWKQFGIGEELLKFYNVHQVQYYWSYEQQDQPYYANDPTFAYRIGEFYQLYSPYNTRDRKFRNDYPPEYFFGYLQLPERGDLLIIDKSAKDVIFCRSLGYNAVCGKSETTFIPERKLYELKDRFKKIYLMLDNDNAGKLMTEKYVNQYPFLIPRFMSKAKDKTDTVKLVGIEETKKEVEQLLT